MWSLDQQHQNRVNLSKMPILSPNPRPNESEALEVGPGNLKRKSPPGDSNKH